MKRPVFLTLIGIGVALLVVGVVFVVPWGGKIVNEMETTGELHHQLIRDLETSAREPLTAEQEKLLAQLLEIAEGTDISENPNDLERVLSSEPYLTYLKVLEGERYEDFSAYIAAMPTPSIRAAARARIKATFGADKGDEELEIWTNYYFSGLLWCAIATPAEFGLMRSFFTDMNAFQALFFYRSEPEEHTLAK